MSNNNNKLRKEVVLPPSGSGAQTTGTDNPKTRLAEIKTSRKDLQNQLKILDKEEKSLKKTTKKPTIKKTVASKKKKTGKKRSLL